MITFSFRALFVTDVIFLVIGPLVVLGLLAWVFILTKRAHGKRLAISMTRQPLLTIIAVHLHSETPSEPTMWHRLRLVLAKVLGWGRFWFSLIVTIGVNVGIVAGYVKINPHVSL